VVSKERISELVEDVLGPYFPGNSIPPDFVRPRIELFENRHVYVESARKRWDYPPVIRINRAVAETSTELQLRGILGKEIAWLMLPAGARANVPKWTMNTIFGLNAALSVEMISSVLDHPGVHAGNWLAATTVTTLAVLASRDALVANFGNIEEDNVNEMRDRHLDDPVAVQAAELTKLAYTQGDLRKRLSGATGFTEIQHLAYHLLHSALHHPVLPYPWTQEPSAAQSVTQARARHRGVAEVSPEDVDKTGEDLHLSGRNVESMSAAGIRRGRRLATAGIAVSSILNYVIAFNFHNENSGDNEKPQSIVTSTDRPKRPPLLENASAGICL
jgi:hypothetical protein